MLDIRHIVGAVLLFVTGLMKLISEGKDFYELEKGIHELCQKVDEGTGLAGTGQDYTSVKGTGGQAK